MVGKYAIALYKKQVEVLRQQTGSDPDFPTNVKHLITQLEGLIATDPSLQAFHNDSILQTNQDGLHQSSRTLQQSKQFDSRIDNAHFPPEIKKEARNKYNALVLQYLAKACQEKNSDIEQQLLAPKLSTLERQKLVTEQRHLTKLSSTITTALANPVNQPSQDAKLIADSSRLLNQLDAGAQALELAGEYFNTAMRNAPHITQHLEAQQNALNELRALPPTTAANATDQLNLINGLLNNLETTAPAESPKFAAAQEKYQALAQVVEFDPLEHTHFAKQHRTAPPEFTEAYNELNNSLAGIRELCVKQGNLAAELASPDQLSKDQLAKKTTAFNEQEDALKQAAQDLNALLISNSNKRDGVPGLSYYSSIEQDKLNQLIEYNKQLMKQTGAKSHRLKHHALFWVTAASITLKPIAGLAQAIYGAITTAHHNREHNTIAGGRFALTSNPAIMEAYGKPSTTTSSTGTWWPEKSHKEPLKDTNGNAIELPIHGAKGLSIISLAQKVFGETACDHIRYNKDGSVTVSWDNKEQGDAWLKAIKEANVNYLKEKNTIKASLTTEALPQVKAALSTTAPTPPASPTSANSGRPGFINPTTQTQTQTDALRQLMQQMQQQNAPPPPIPTASS